MAAAVVLFLFDPAGSSFYPSCPFRWLTGLDCPGCGSLRALHQLLHGNIRAAFELNPFIMFAAPYLVYSLSSWLLLKTLGHALPAPGAEIRHRLIYALVALILVYWVFRNTAAYSALMARL